MARGHDTHKERMGALSALGRALARRAKSACELCAETGARLQPREVEPLPEEPQLDHTAFICERCCAGLDNIAKVDADEWRFLETAVWHELDPVKVLAVRAAKGLAANGAAWANELLDNVWLDEELQTWVDQA